MNDEVLLMKEDDHLIDRVVQSDHRRCMYDVDVSAAFVACVLLVVAACIG